MDMGTVGTGTTVLLLFLLQAQNYLEFLKHPSSTKLTEKQKTNLNKYVHWGQWPSNLSSP
jgi:hypothetical protein